MNKEFFKFLAAASIVASMSLFAGGCAQQAKTTDSGMGSSDAKSESGMKADTGDSMGREESLSDKGWAGQDASAVLEGRTSAPMLPVYFDFDQSGIRADQQGRISKNGDFLISNSAVRVRVEGNCDERGTNEYNMALGERRALSAKKYLANLGVAESRIDTISYGEEKPINYGHDDLAWSQNRRADFVITK